jgi:hypothetical protein
VILALAATRMTAPIAHFVSFEMGNFIETI